jgi:hypothetical protein
VPDEAQRPESTYAERVQAFAREAQAWTARFNRVANLRLVAFAASAACVIWGILQAATLAIAAGVVLGVVLVMLVRHHRELGRRRDRAVGLQAINQVALERIRRYWNGVPLRHTQRADAAHLYALDLDLFGHASIMHLLDTAATPMGRATLARWLLERASPTTVRERQHAMLELKPELELRQELEASGDASLDPEPFLAWAESPRPRQRPAIIWAARISPVLLVGLALAHVGGLVSGPWWLALLLVNAWLWHTAGRFAYATLVRIDDQQTAFQQYAASFGLLARASFDAPRLQHLLRIMSADGQSAFARMGALARITQFVIPRGAQVYWVVQPILLWDVHVLAALETWQARSGRHTRAWLDALGEMEALAALAGLAHSHPDWTVPEIDIGAERLEARQAGHPLLAPAVRVDNDVSIGPGGTFVLVTGSNMAGKSTYLRTIGVNIVLAQAGGPVCARAWRMPPLSLCTSMRVVDSLERGVSTFLAEVLRLKQVVEAARAAHAQDATMCFLLDEILQGTNTAERQIAARQVIRFLIGRGVMGAVSTHDLGLVDEADLRAAARLLHFRETLKETANGPLMTFDHRVREGLATSTNALRLVAMLGLDDPPPISSSDVNSDKHRLDLHQQ